MMQNIKKFLFLLSLHERKRAALLLIMMLIMALLDMIGVASILPFMAVISNPEIIETNLILNKIFQISKIFGVQDNQQFLLFLGILLLIILVISISFKAFTTFLQMKFIQMRQYSIGKRLLEGCLHQPYSWFLNRNSSEVSKTILSEVAQVVGGIINPLMQLITNSMITIAIISLLIIVNPVIAITVGFSVSFLYAIIFFYIRKYLNRIGKERLDSNKFRFSIISEAFGAAKVIKVGGLEQIYINQFSIFGKKFALNTAMSQILNLLPRYALEILVFGSIMVLILNMMASSGNFNTLIPILSLYLFAGYRLMPAIQKIYVTFATFTFNIPALNKLYDEMFKVRSFNSNFDEGIISLNKSLICKNISFSYSETQRRVLDNVNLVIPAKSSVGFIGTTGSGKTTLVDIILGLFEPQNGTLEVDDLIITKQNKRAWQRSIGYVPQNIYLSDDTIACNIAFGVDPKNIDQNLLKKVCNIANLKQFIESELPEKYQTKVGERGIKLSGGQLQRIGIARALYQNPKVLILDEATSALDNETELKIMNNINNLEENITIIIIAHRLNTVKNCDMIFKLENGKIVDQGAFSQLINDS